MLMQTLNQLLEENMVTKRDTHHLPVNIEESEKGYHIKAKCHGFTKNDITIEYNKPYITIKAQKEKKENSNSTIWQEFEEVNKIERYIKVGNINNKTAEATLEDGILTLILTKKEETKTHKITIN